LFQQYGLAAVFVFLLLENFGLPLPGELVLLYAGYHMQVYGAFGLPSLLLIGSLACIAGQTAGYGLGRSFGPWVRRSLPIGAERQAALMVYFERHGPPTIVFARFIVGLRVFAGLLAGLYHMPWRPFLIYNIVGAVAWVAVVSEAGALLGSQWQRLLRLAGHVDLLIFLVAAVLIVIAWRKLRRRVSP